jgi:hypothetical protein
MKIFIYSNRYPGCELNRGSLKYKAGMLPAGPPCSVYLKVVVIDSRGQLFPFVVHLQSYGVIFLDNALNNVRFTADQRAVGVFELHT